MSCSRKKLLSTGCSYNWRKGFLFTSQDMRLAQFFFFFFNLRHLEYKGTLNLCGHMQHPEEFQIDHLLLYPSIENQFLNRSKFVRSSVRPSCFLEFNLQIAVFKILPAEFSTRRCFGPKTNATENVLDQIRFSATCHIKPYF